MSKSAVPKGRWIFVTKVTNPLTLRGLDIENRALQGGFWGGRSTCLSVSI